MLGKAYSPLIYSVSLNLSQVLVSCVGSNFVNVGFPAKKGKGVGKACFSDVGKTKRLSHGGGGGRVCGGGGGGGGGISFLASCLARKKASAPKTPKRMPVIKIGRKDGL